MVGAPLTVLLVWHTNVAPDGSLAALAREIARHGLVGTVVAVGRPVLVGGLMAWPLVLLSFAAAQHERHGLADSMMVAVGLQLVYVAKFFWWEPAYLRSLDIMHLASIATNYLADAQRQRVRATPLR